MQRGSTIVHEKQQSVVPQREDYYYTEGEGGYYVSLEDGEIEKGHYWDSIHRRNRSWVTTVVLVVLRIFAPKRYIHSFRHRPIQSIGRLLLLSVVGTFCWWGLSSSYHIISSRSSLIYHEEDIHRILEWEIISGHWMSWRPLSAWYNPPQNPSLPSPQEADEADRPGGIRACGWPRKYILANEFQAQQNNQTKNTAFPPRPAPGSIVDFDLVNERCDPTTGQYLRDCLEYLRIGAGLDNTAPHLRHGKTDESPPTPRFYEKPRSQKKEPLPVPQNWRYTYLEDRLAMHAPISSWSRYAGGKALEKPLNLPTPIPPTGGIPAYTIGYGTQMIGVVHDRPPEEVKKDFKWIAGQCEKDYPRIFHTYLEPPLTKATYMTFLSFLYTQNLGLSLNLTEAEREKKIPCRPQFWIWLKNMDTEGPRWKEMLLKSPWAGPLVESRFKGLIKFKTWNATEQMDATPDWSSEWRNAATLDTRKKTRVSHDGEYGSNVAFSGPTAGDILHQTFNISMSDTARWLLPHRYGGIFVDPSVLFLRDWEEIWNYRGAFVSFSTRSQPNPAIKLNKQSALGTFVLRTSLRHGLGLDTASVRKYARDAQLEELLYPFPSMLSNLADWHHDEYQRSRPPLPNLSSPDEFFEPDGKGAPTEQLGIPAFFRGAWFYYAQPTRSHSFDKGRHYPDTGRSDTRNLPDSATDERDLSWSAVFKRSYEVFLRGEAPNMYGEWLS
ncbi:hypothetical protein FS842_005830 [Serendipita sp. 407]|nr:hypothetical protein FS842_005830 [Serendipita sp. 407]